MTFCKRNFRNNVSNLYFTVVMKNNYFIDSIHKLYLNIWLFRSNHIPTRQGSGLNSNDKSAKDKEKKIENLQHTRHTRYTKAKKKTYEMKLN